MRFKTKNEEKLLPLLEEFAAALLAEQDELDPIHRKACIDLNKVAQSAIGLLKSEDWKAAFECHTLAYFVSDRLRFTPKLLHAWNRVSQPIYILHQRWLRHIGKA